MHRSSCNSNTTGRNGNIKNNKMKGKSSQYKKGRTTKKKPQNAKFLKDKIVMFLISKITI